MVINANHNKPFLTRTVKHTFVKPKDTLPLNTRNSPNTEDDTIYTIPKVFHTGYVDISFDFVAVKISSQAGEDYLPFGKRVTITHYTHDTNKVYDVSSLTSYTGFNKIGVMFACTQTDQGDNIEVWIRATAFLQPDDGTLGVSYPQGEVYIQNISVCDSAIGQNTGWLNPADPDYLPNVDVNFPNAIPPAVRPYVPARASGLERLNGDI